MGKRSDISTGSLQPPLSLPSALCFFLCRKGSLASSVVWVWETSDLGSLLPCHCCSSENFVAEPCFFLSHSGSEETLFQNLSTFCLIAVRMCLPLCYLLLHLFLWVLYLFKQPFYHSDCVHCFGLPEVLLALNAPSFDWLSSPPPPASRQDLAPCPSLLCQPVSQLGSFTTPVPREEKKAAFPFGWIWGLFTLLTVVHPIISVLLRLQLQIQIGKIPYPPQDVIWGGKGR